MALWQPTDLMQAILSGIVGGGSALGGVFLWARNVGRRLDKHEAQISGPEGLMQRVTILEQQGSNTAQAITRIEQMVSAVHRRLDEYQASGQAERVRMAERLGELTAELRKARG